MTTTEITKARTALDQAEAAIRPLDPETTAKLQAMVGPAKWANMQAEIEALRATIPALAAKLTKLQERGCGRCLGTGTYGGPSSHTIRGWKVCFTCGGSGFRH